ncbi:MAG TPA: hypothetical protein VEI48_02350 [Candidatus Sulfotelmatobacter sp.]|nr:hypothetical protein [Candidatus Sulfotelmatobacter sp.]
MPRQFVIQIDNHPGELAHLTRALAARGVNLHCVSCAGAGPLACCLIVPDDFDAMREVLRGLGHAFIEGDAVMVDVENRPGGLADVAERLATAGVNILGTLCVGRRPGILEMAFTVDDEAKARRALGLDAPAAVAV